MFLWFSQDDPSNLLIVPIRKIRRSSEGISKCELVQRLTAVNAFNRRERRIPVSRLQKEAPGPRFDPGMIQRVCGYQWAYGRLAAPVMLSLTPGAVRFVRATDAEFRAALEIRTPLLGFVTGATYTDRYIYLPFMCQRKLVESDVEI